MEIEGLSGALSGNIRIESLTVSDPDGVYLTARDLALRFEDAGAAAIIHTDIDRDGMLGGVNVEATAALGARLTTPVIASGGVAGVEDITAVREAGTIEGVIVGRALYDGRLTAAQALTAAG